MHLRWCGKPQQDEKRSDRNNRLTVQVLGQALDATGEVAGADLAYRRMIELDETGALARRAQDALRKIAGDAFHSATPGVPRMDAVTYRLGALEKFETMAPADVQKVSHEIALLAINEIEVNNPDSRYRLRSLPGEFSGLQPVCLEQEPAETTARLYDCPAPDLITPAVKGRIAALLQDRPVRVSRRNLSP